jgi:hypothetical protein
MAEKRRFTLVYRDGREEPYRTRKRVLIGDILPVESREAYGYARVTGMGWEGDSFVLHVVECRP